MPRPCGTRPRVESDLPETRVEWQYILRIYYPAVNSMKYKVGYDTQTSDGIKALWELPADATVLDITPMGDVFLELPDGEFVMISVTDGEVMTVTEEIKEYGLPPVDVALGDDWYHLDAQAALSEAGLTLNTNECFGFKTPLFKDGDYSAENIEVVDILDYHKQVHQSLAAS